MTTFPAREASRASLAAVGLVGLCCGVVGSALGARLFAAPTPTVPAASTPLAPLSAAPARTVVELHGADPTRIAAVEAKVAALASAPSGTPFVGPPSLSAGATFAADRARHEAVVAAHLKEPVDALWAGKASSALKASLDPAASAGAFKVESLVCRHHTCAAVVAWPTFSDAAKGLRAIVDAELSLNCGRTMALVDEAVPGQPYRTTVIFDCESAKYGDG